jgi:hypothetical protein
MVSVETSLAWGYRFRMAVSACADRWVHIFTFNRTASSTDTMVTDGTFLTTRNDARLAVYAAATINAQKLTEKVNNRAALVRGRYSKCVVNAI